MFVELLTHANKEFSLLLDDDAPLFSVKCMNYPLKSNRFCGKELVPFALIICRLNHYKLTIARRACMKHDSL